MIITLQNTLASYNDRGTFPQGFPATCISARQRVRKL